MIAGRRFYFRPVLTIFAALSLAVLISLGTWQVKRLEWKLDLIAKTEARIDAQPIPFLEALERANNGEDMEYAPVTLTGILDAALEEKVFGAIEGEPGAFLFAPVRVHEGAFVYVNRGFVPQSVATWRRMQHNDDVVVTGLFRYAEDPAPPASWFRATTKSGDGLWFIRDPLLFAANAEIEAAAYYVDSFAVEGRDWPKGGTTRLDFSNRHLEYALTWYGLALTLLGVWVVFSLQKPE